MGLYLACCSACCGSCSSCSARVSALALFDNSFNVPYTACPLWFLQQASSTCGSIRSRRSSDTIMSNPHRPASAWLTQLQRAKVSVAGALLHPHPSSLSASDNNGSIFRARTDTALVTACCCVWRPPACLPALLLAFRPRTPTASSPRSPFRTWRSVQMVCAGTVLEAPAQQDPRSPSPDSNSVHSSRQTPVLVPR